MSTPSSSKKSRDRRQQIVRSDPATGLATSTLSPRLKCTSRAATSAAAVALPAAAADVPDLVPRPRVPVNLQNLKLPRIRLYPARPRKPHRIQRQPQRPRQQRHDAKPTGRSTKRTRPDPPRPNPLPITSCTDVAASAPSTSISNSSTSPRTSGCRSQICRQSRLQHRPRRITNQHVLMLHRAAVHAHQLAKPPRYQFLVTSVAHARLDQPAPDCPFAFNNPWISNSSSRCRRKCLSHILTLLYLDLAEIFVPRHQLLRMRQSRSPACFGDACSSLCRFIKSTRRHPSPRRYPRRRHPAQ